MCDRGLLILCGHVEVSNGTPCLYCSIEHLQHAMPHVNDGSVIQTSQMALVEYTSIASIEVALINGH